MARKDLLRCGKCPLCVTGYCLVDKLPRGPGDHCDVVASLALRMADWAKVYLD